MPKFDPRAAQVIFAGKGWLGFVVFVSATFLSVSGAKEFLIDNWRFDDDLPRDGIISIAQGSDGYLWMSSRFGLARFDGVRFANMNAQAEALFLGHHYANLTADHLGIVWIGTPGGGLLRWQNERLTRCMPPSNPIFGPVLAGLTNALGRDLAVTPDGRVVGWSNGLIDVVATANRWGEPVPSSVCQDKQGNIWFVTYQHKLVRVEGTNAEELVYGEGENRRNWIALQTDASGALWAGTQRDVGVWHGVNFQPLSTPVQPFPVDDLIAVPSSREYEQSSGSGIQASRSRLWVVAVGRVWLVENGRWLTNTLFEPSAGLYETSPRIADREGNLWFTATQARLIRAGIDGSLRFLDGKDGLPVGRIAFLYEDRERSIWIGIEHAGLARLRERYFTTFGAHDGIKAPLVWAVAEDTAGAIWLGTENGGLHRWQEGKFTQFNLGNSGLAGSIYSLCLDRQGVLWAGTGHKGVVRFENGKFVSAWEYQEPGWNKRVYVIYEDRLGRMWFGTGLGLFRWENGSVRRCPGKDFQMGVPRVIAEDASGHMWVGLSGGAEMRLAWLEGEELVPCGAPQGLLGRDIFGLHADAAGSMWIGTADNGLWRWRDGAYAHYTTTEGLPDDRIHSIEQDRTGNLWLGSPGGIIRLSKHSVAALEGRQTNRLDCLIFDRSDGLPTRECSGGSQPSIYQGRDGRLLFAMTEGAAALSPETLQINRTAPPVLVEEVRVDGNPIQPEKAAPILAVGPGRHVVEFRYTATSLAAPSKVRFKCKLDGVDTQWRDADAARSAMYSLTSPGEYRFHVTACNNDGAWNEQGVAMALTVAPYLWQTFWFRITAALALLSAVGGTIRFLERRKLQRKVEHLEMQRLVEMERARIARDIHDDLGASLTEIGLLSEFAQRDSTPAKQVKADVQKIAAQARSSTRALDEIVWAVNPRNDTLEGFVTYACAYAEEQLRLAEIRCRLEIPSPPPTRLLRADLRHHLFLAFKEALNNVVKHARASQADIHITIENHRMSVSVSDNGCGYNPDEPVSHKGNGLANMKERLEKIGGSFECESAPGTGTRVRFTIKLEDMG